MRKIFIFAALLAFSSSAKAQSAGLCIDATQSPCGVYVNMYAQDIADGYPICSIVSNTVYVAATTAMCWKDVWAFQSDPLAGWNSATVSIPLTATDFVWTDAQYQWDCPPGFECSDAGWRQTNAYGSCFLPAINPYPSPYCSGTPLESSWTPMGGTGPMAEPTILFYW